MTSGTVEQINTALIACFVKSVKNVLSTMAGLECEPGDPALKTNPSLCHDVSCLVGFSGDVTGTVVVTFREETAIGLVETFAGKKMEATSEEFVDAIGELCSMIAGNAKKDFGLRAGIGIPTVIVGPGHTVARPREVPCVVVPCTSDVGDFAVEINIKQVAGATGEK